MLGARFINVGAAIALALSLAGGARGRAEAATPAFYGVWQALPGTAAYPPGGGLYTLPKDDPPVPYNAEYQKEFDDKRAKIKAGDIDVGGWCQPPGMPQIAAAANRFEFATAPGEMFILYETQSQIRRIFLNGKHPDSATAETTLNGHSIGHWDGDTLVIDTIGMKDFTNLTRDFGSHSDEVHSIERWRLVDKDTLSLELEVQDPLAFTHPWKLKRTFKRETEPLLSDYECNENPRHQMSIDGRMLNVAPAK